VLQLIFKIADDNGLLLLDLKDLRALCQYVGDNGRQFTTAYGNVSAASVGAIQRGLLTIDQQGGDKFFGEPMLDISDLIQTAVAQASRLPDSAGGTPAPQQRGVINILAADRLYNSPQLYATFLLWIMSELFEQLPEIGDFEDELEHAGLDVVEIQQAAEEQRAHVGDGGADGVAFVAKDVPENDGVCGGGEVLDAEQVDALFDFSARGTGGGEAGEIAFDVGHEDGHADAGEAFGHGLERDCFARAGGAGDEAVAVGHVGEEFDAGAGIREGDEEGVGHF